MATNEVYDSARILKVAVSNPTTPASNDPVRWGYRIGVAMRDEDADGNTVVKFDGVFDLSVKGVDGGGNSAVAAGDAIFYVDGDTPKLSKKATGYFVGHALEAVGSGQTATIKVALGDSPGSGTLASGGVGTTQLTDAGVTAAKLSSNLARGFIRLPLTAFRLISSNDIPNSGSADGGVVSQDTVPKLERINDATDKGLRIAWAANEVIGITQQFEYPPDLDDTADVTVNLLYYKNGNTNSSMTVGVAYFEGIGDTNAGGNTAALTGTTLTEVAVTIAHANIGAHPNVATVEIVPGAHANDALYLMGAWVEYARKS